MKQVKICVSRLNAIKIIMWHYHDCYMYKNAHIAQKLNKIFFRVGKEFLKKIFFSNALKCIGHMQHYNSYINAHITWKLKTKFLKIENW